MVESDYNNEDQKAINPSDFMAGDFEFNKQRMIEGLADIQAELFVKWKKNYSGVAIFPASFTGINPEALNLMLSFSATNFYNNLAKKFNLNESQRDALSQLVWKIVLENNFSNVASMIGEKLGLEQNVSGQIAESLEKNILFKVQSLLKTPVARRIDPDEERRKQLVSIAFSLALKKHDKLGEQLISGNPIKLKIFDTPVRPSIKNWIADYYEKVDARKHDSIERGNYLFHSENARRLTTGERQRVGTMLRALDEGSEIAMDPVKYEMVFGSNDLMENKTASVNIYPSAGPVQEKASVDFSSAHKFPSEMNRISPIKADPRQLQRASGNVVDLRE